MLNEITVKFRGNFVGIRSAGGCKDVACGPPVEFAHLDHILILLSHLPHLDRALNSLITVVMCRQETTHSLTCSPCPPLHPYPQAYIHVLKCDGDGRVPIAARRYSLRRGFPSSVGKASGEGMLLPRKFLIFAYTSSECRVCVCSLYSIPKST